MVDRESVLSELGRAGGGVRIGELAASLGVGRGDRRSLRAIVNQLLDEGVVERVGRGKYAISAADDDSHATGQIRVHPAGYGFVERDDGLGDIFVPAKYRGSALDGDRVLLATWQGHRGTEGRVEEVLARGRAKLTGTIHQTGRSLHLEPDDPRIAADFGVVELEDGGGGARPGESVVVEIVRYPSELDPTLAGRVVRVLGDPEDPRTEVEKIIVCADIPAQFPPEAEAQAAETPQVVGAEDFADRIDLRDRKFITVDPETARDFDDALCIEPGPDGGSRVWVAVADVSHYVQAGDALDAEARIRGVSVYLPDRVVPMLPLQLSAAICSLNPDVDRCAMVVRLDYDKSGVLVDRGFAAAVIRSKARLDYMGVAAALSGDFRGRREQYKQWVEQLRALDKLAGVLRERRRARGTLELEIPEAKVVLDDDDPLLVRSVVRAVASEAVRGAYRMVEEFMIAANEAVGAYFAERGLHTIWRVHAPPEQYRVEELAETLAFFDVDVNARKALTPSGMRAVLAQLSGHPAARALSFLILRTLQQAVYDTNNVGHFGLASQQYLHFTSPIRRYPDLEVHRLLKYHLHKEGQASGGGAAGDLPELNELQMIASASSSHERRAIEAEREAVAMYRAYLMREHVGEEFSGKISGVTNFGVFIEMEDPFVEGLVKSDSLSDDYYEFDPVRLQLTGRRSGQTLALGDEVRVEIAATSVTLRRVELHLVGREASGARGRGGRGTDSRGRKGTGGPAKSRRAARRESQERAKKQARKVSDARGRRAARASRDSQSGSKKSRTGGGKGRGGAGKKRR